MATPLFMLLLLIPSIIVSADDCTKWHYEEELDACGPSNWGTVPGGELCNHYQQSPIEIDPSNFQTSNQSCITPLDWNIDNTTYNFSVTHKGEAGHTIVFKNKLLKQIYLNNLFPSNNQHNTYLLHSFHMHWGKNEQRGSEHVFTGIATTLEIHFVHYSSDYNSLSEALSAYGNSDDPHTLAVIGILFQEVADTDPALNEMADSIIQLTATNPAMNQLWHNATGKVYLDFAITDLFDVEDLKNNYYHYYGSLTTPPCTPAVNWHLYSKTIKIRKSTMDLFRTETQIWQDETGQIDADHNFRSIQSNPSCIDTCGERWCPHNDKCEYFVNNQQMNHERKYLIHALNKCSEFKLSNGYFSNKYVCNYNESKNVIMEIWYQGKHCQEHYEIGRYSFDMNENNFNCYDNPNAAIDNDSCDNDSNLLSIRWYNKDPLSAQGDCLKKKGFYQDNFLITGVCIPDYVNLYNGKLVYTMFECDVYNLDWFWVGHYLDSDCSEQSRLNGMKFFNGQCFNGDIIDIRGCKGSGYGYQDYMEVSSSFPYDSSLSSSDEIPYMRNSMHYR